MDRGIVVDRGALDAKVKALEGELQAILPALGKHRIEGIQRIITDHYAGRFKPRNRKPKYGSLNKGFTQEQLIAFLHAVDNVKFRLLYEYQAYMGLRIGEVCELNLKDINLQTRELLIRNRKTKTLDELIIPLELFKETIQYIQDFKDEIGDAKGYLFFTEAKFSRRHNIHVDPAYVRNRFRHYLIASGLDEVYEISAERDDRKPRQLHRLTTHGLRHFAITRVAKKTNGNLVLTSRFARHREVNTTMTYVHSDKSELYGVIDGLGGVEELKRNLI